MIDCCLAPLFNFNKKYQVESQVSKMERLSILIVDDNIIYQKLLQKMLSKYYYIDNITVADDGLKAVKLIQSQQFDIIFMDIDMPIMNGIECTKVIRNSSINAMNRFVPIIAVTTNSKEEDLKLYKTIGMNGHIQKPFEFDSLVKYLNYAVKLKLHLNY